MPLRVLVTGASGFLGRALVAQLRTLGHAPLGANRIGGEGDSPHLDLTKPEGFDEAFERLAPDVVVNAAAASTYGPIENLELLARTNTLGAFLLFLASAKRQIRFVQIGSGLEYGASDQALNEDSPPQPKGAYASSKLAAWLLMRGADLPKAELTCLRLFNLCGPGNPLPRLDAAIRQAAREGTRVKLKTPRHRRDFMLVDDVARGIAAIAAAPAGLFPHGQVVNLGRGEGTTVGEFATLLLQALGRPELLDLSEADSSDESLFPTAARWLDLTQRLGLPPPHPLTDAAQLCAKNDS